MMRALQPFLTHFAQPQVLWLLCTLPCLWAVGIASNLRRAKALQRFGSRAALRSLTVVSRPRRWLSAVAFSAGFALLVVAAAGPQWGVDSSPALATGRDLVLVLDVSRSMLAEDAVPSRVGWAQRALIELVDDVARHGGHRLGLVAFAGRAVVICPLTPDYDHFREALWNLDPRDTRFAPVAGADEPSSGTRIGAALAEAVLLHEPRFREFQDILLLSDGDDPAHDNEWQHGIQAARAAGIPIHTVGVGNPLTDSTIPDEHARSLRWGGQDVLTRLQEQPLIELTRLTGGAYFPAWNERRPLRDWYSSWTRARPGREFGDEPLPALVPRYAWFFAPALALLVLATLVSDRSLQGAGTSRQSGVYVRSSAWLVPVAFALVSASPAVDADRWVRLGNDAFGRGDYAQALEYYGRAEEYTTDPGLVALNEAAALYRMGRFREAELHYVRALEDALGERRGRALFDLGNALVQGCQGNDAAPLDRAIAAYEECLRSAEIAPELRDDARHNLQLTRTLRQHAKGNSKKQSSDSGKESPEDGQRPPHSSRNGSESFVGGVDPRGQPGKGIPGRRGQGGQPQATQQRQPGAGNLPPVPDSNELLPLAPEDAHAHLQQAAQRILNDQQKHKLHLSRPTRNVLDW